MIYKLNHRIKITQPESLVDNQAGVQTNKNSPQDYWCSVKQKSGFKDSVNDWQKQMVFVKRYFSSNITKENYIVTYNGIDYKILSIDNSDLIWEIITAEALQKENVIDVEIGT